MKNDLTKEQLEQPITVMLPLGVVLNITGTDDAVFVETARATSLAGLPAIGHPYQNGTYAGLSLEDERPIALILLPGENESITWDVAVEWAKKQGGVLPSRVDQLVLFKNLKREFKEAAYWSGEQYAGVAGYAWYQYFDYGTQSSYYKDSELRARAVRRLPIQ